MDHKVSKNFSFILKVCIFSICSINSLCYPQSGNSKPKLTIALVDFIYISTEVKTDFKIEKDVLIPAIDEHLRRSGISNFKFKIKQVTHGTLENFAFGEAMERMKQYSDQSYDIAIFGQVKPYNGWPQEYRLKIMVFTNPSKYKLCIFDYELEIRDGKIMHWSDKWGETKCNESETKMGVIPSIICYKMIHKNKISQTELEGIKQKLLRGIQIPTLTNLLALNLDQDCNSVPLGYLKLKLKDGGLMLLPLSSSLAASIQQEVQNHQVTYSWPIEASYNVDLLAQQSQASQNQLAADSNPNRGKYASQRAGIGIGMQYRFDNAKKLPAVLGKYKLTNSFGLNIHAILYDKAPVTNKKTKKSKILRSYALDATLDWDALNYKKLNMFLNCGGGFIQAPIVFQNKTTKSSLKFTFGGGVRIYINPKFGITLSGSYQTIFAGSYQGVGNYTNLRSGLIYYFK